jgi:murein DD-endopeptidase MepM/ murein hydrolase activator NlpD
MTQILLAAALGLLAATALVGHPVLAVRLALAAPPQALAVPVVGVPSNSLRDSWGAPRSGGRRHRGIDIFARRGARVVSPVDGIVLGVGRNRLGGNVVRVLGPGLQVHYFAHLDRFGAITRRERIRRGDVVGFVGDTGNARGTPPHLHYGIYAPPGRAINPHPLLAASRASRGHGTS